MPPKGSRGGRVSKTRWMKAVASSSSSSSSSKKGSSESDSDWPIIPRRLQFEAEYSSDQASIQDDYDEDISRSVRVGLNLQPLGGLENFLRKSDHELRLRNAIFAASILLHRMQAFDMGVKGRDFLNAKWEIKEMNENFEEITNSKSPFKYLDKWIMDRMRARKKIPVALSRDIQNFKSSLQFYTKQGKKNRKLIAKVTCLDKLDKYLEAGALTLATKYGPLPKHLAADELRHAMCNIELNENTEGGEATLSGVQEYCQVLLRLPQESLIGSQERDAIHHVLTEVGMNRIPGSKFNRMPTFDEIPNFAYIDGLLYRGGAPSEEGIKWLDENEFGLIIDLRHEDLTDEHMVAPHIQYERLLIRRKKCPTLSDIDHFVVMAETYIEKGQKVLVHCDNGVERTGVMAASWRATRGMTTEQALCYEGISENESKDTDVVKAVKNYAREERSRRRRMRE